jgi:hypothetical protein
LKSTLNENVKIVGQESGRVIPALSASEQQWLMIVCWPGVCFLCKLYPTVTVFLATFALFSDDKGANEDLHSLIQIESCVITCRHSQGSLNHSSTKGKQNVVVTHDAEFIFSVIESVLLKQPHSLRPV